MKQMGDIDWQGQQEYIERTGKVRATLSRLSRAAVAIARRPSTVGAVVVALVSAAVVVAVYANHPGVETSTDTASYLGPAYRLLTHTAPLLDTERTPGYPLLIAAVLRVAGMHNLAAVANVHGGLYVVAAVEAYGIGLLLTRRVWMAGLLGLLTVGLNTNELTFARPILSEGPTFFLVMTLALAVVWYTRLPTLRRLWLIAACALALFATRPEWVYAIVPLFAWLLCVAGLTHGWRKALRSIAPHLVGAVLGLYVLVAIYIAANGAVTGYAGLTEIQNVDLLGKVMQYGMQNYPSPKYPDAQHAVAQVVATGDLVPWDAVVRYRPFIANHFALAGAYASSVVWTHPVEYVWDTLQLIPATLYPDGLGPTVVPSGPFAAPLNVLHALSNLVHRSVQLFLPLALLIAVLLVCWRRARNESSLLMLAGIMLLAAYDLCVTDAASFSSYLRLHVPIEPLMLLTVIGAALLVLAWLTRLIRLSILNQVSRYRSARSASLTGTRTLPLVTLSVVPSTANVLTVPRTPSQ